MTYFAFDIKSIPDVEGGRRLYDLERLTDEEHEAECDVVQNTLAPDISAHLIEILNTWQR